MCTFKNVCIVVRILRDFFNVCVRTKQPEKPYSAEPSQQTARKWEREGFKGGMFRLASY